MEIVRVESPTVEEFSAAFEVCKLRIPHLRPLDTRARFEGLRRLGVQLIAAKEGERFVGTCFVLPCAFRFGGETLRWVCPFQLAIRPESKNVGALLFMRITNAYPAIVSMGITREARPFYPLLRWKRHDDLWRGVHPIRLDAMLGDLEYRMGQPWKGSFAGAMAGVYNVFSDAAERVLSYGVDISGGRSKPADPESCTKEDVMSSYMEMLGAGPYLRCANVGGFGRVLNSFSEGAGAVRHHARLWSELRRQGARACELLIGSTRARLHAARLGYLAVRMPMYYVDRDGTVEKLIRALRRDEVSFLHTDKTV